MHPSRDIEHDSWPAVFQQVHLQRAAPDTLLTVNPQVGIEKHAWHRLHLCAKIVQNKIFAEERS